MFELPSDPPAKDGGPAFPKVPDDTRNGSSGMSLRDWFAGQVIEQCICNCLNTDGSWDPDNVAHHAYLVADAMLAARSLKQEGN